MNELTTDQALGFIADGLCSCEGTLEDSHTDGCPQDNEARAWLAQVRREAKVEALRSAASEIYREEVRHLGPMAHIQDIGYQDGLLGATKRIRARADRMEAGEQ